MKHYKKYVIYLVVLVVTFLAGMYSKPAKVVTKEVIKIERHTEQSEDIAETGVVREKEITLPDGTKEVYRVREYSNTARVRTESRESVAKSSERTETNQVQHQFHALYTLDRDDKRPIYTLGYSYRLFGSLYGTLQTNTKLDRFSVGLTLGF